MSLSRWEFSQINAAYRRMIDEAGYRAKPINYESGWTKLEPPESHEELEREILQYAIWWNEHETGLKFPVGIFNSTERIAGIFTIEAARCLCGGEPLMAMKLLKMAIAQLDDPDDPTLRYEVT